VHSNKCRKATFLAQTNALICQESPVIRSQAGNERSTRDLVPIGGGRDATVELFEWVERETREAQLSRPDPRLLPDIQTAANRGQLGRWTEAEVDIARP
jgi:hypothetical protein